MREYISECTSIYAWIHIRMCIYACADIYTWKAVRMSTWSAQTQSHLNNLRAVIYIYINMPINMYIYIYIYIYIYSAYMHTKYKTIFVRFVSCRISWTGTQTRIAECMTLYTHAYTYMHGLNVSWSLSHEQPPQRFPPLHLDACMLSCIHKIKMTYFWLTSSQFRCAQGFRSDLAAHCHALRMSLNRMSINIYAHTDVYVCTCMYACM